MGASRLRSKRGNKLNLGTLSGGKRSLILPASAREAPPVRLRRHRRRQIQVHRALRPPGYRELGRQPLRTPAPRPPRPRVRELPRLARQAQPQAPGHPHRPPAGRLDHLVQSVTQTPGIRSLGRRLQLRPGPGPRLGRRGNRPNTPLRPLGGGHPPDTLPEWLYRKRRDAGPHPTGSPAGAFLPTSPTTPPARPGALPSAIPRNSTPRSRAP